MSSGDVSPTTEAQGSARTPAARKAGFLRSLDILKVLTGLAAAGGLLLHLMGTYWHDAYMREWGLDAAMFPLGADRLVINGFFNVLIAAVGLWQSMLEELSYVLVVALLIGFAWHANGWLDKKIEVMDVAPRWMAKLPRWIASTAVRSLLILWVLMTVTIAVSGLAVMLALPLQLADSAAKKQVKAQRASFARGCGTKSRVTCVELRRGVEIVGTGPLIESSPENIAFYDVAKGRARLIPRAGIEMLSEWKATP